MKVLINRWASAISIAFILTSCQNVEIEPDHPVVDLVNSWIANHSTGVVGQVTALDPTYKLIPYCEVGEICDENSRYRGFSYEDTWRKIDIMFDAQLALGITRDNLINHFNSLQISSFNPFGIRYFPRISSFHVGIAYPGWDFYLSLPTHPLATDGNATDSTVDFLDYSAGTVSMSITTVATSLNAVSGHPDCYNLLLIFTSSTRLCSFSKKANVPLTIHVTLPMWDQRVVDCSDLSNKSEEVACFFNIREPLSM